MRCSTETGDRNAFALEIFRRFYIRPHHHPIIKQFLDADEHDRVAALQTGGRHQRAGHLTELNFTGHKRRDRNGSRHVDDFEVEVVLLEQSADVGNPQDPVLGAGRCVADPDFVGRHRDCAENQQRSQNSYDD